METVSIRVTINVSRMVKFDSRPGEGDLANVTVAETQDYVDLKVAGAAVTKLTAEADQKAARIMAANVALRAAYDAAESDG